MLGQIVWQDEAGHRVRAVSATLLELPVLRVALAPAGFGLERRVKKTGKLLARRGVRRALVPAGFSHWQALRQRGISPVEPLPFLRSRAGALLLAALEARGVAPGRCTVALRGRRTDRDMALAAQFLAPLVREVLISAPVGGENLRRWLAEEWGIAPRPDTPGVEGAICFDSSAQEEGGVVLHLHEERVELAGVVPRLPGTLSAEGTELLPLLAALWEAGRLRPEEVIFQGNKRSEALGFNVDNGRKLW